MKLVEALSALFEDLDKVAAQYEELTDTEVSDNIRLVLNYYFVCSISDRRVPRTYGMFSAVGDQVLAAVMSRFLVACQNASDLDAVAIGEARNELLQSVTHTLGGRATAEFVGVCAEPLPPELPDELFELGEYE